MCHLVPAPQGAEAWELIFTTLSHRFCCWASGIWAKVLDTVFSSHELYSTELNELRIERTNLWKLRVKQRKCMPLNLKPRHPSSTAALYPYSHTGRLVHRINHLAESKSPMDLPKTLSVSQIWQASKTSRTMGNVVPVRLKVWHVVHVNSYAWCGQDTTISYPWSNMCCVLQP